VTAQRIGSSVVARRPFPVMAHCWNRQAPRQ